MNTQDLRQILTPYVIANNAEECIRILSEYKVRGGKQLDAYDVLQDLREDKTTLDAEDFILDLMDVVSGWCQVHNRIWDDALENRYLLYRVTEVERGESETVLLPGVSQFDVVSRGIGYIKQGTVVEIKFPNGRRVNTPITSYFIRPTIGPNGQLDVQNSPIIFCISSDVQIEHHDSGLELWVHI